MESSWTDPWESFESTLAAGASADALTQVLEWLGESRTGTAAERQELLACVVSLLAELGERSLEEAVEETRRASEFGMDGWPNLDLSQAANALGAPEIALACLERVPDAYFDTQGLHWRTIQLREQKVIAHVLLGDGVAALADARVLNREYRDEDEEEFLAAPTRLVRQLLDAGPPWDVLEALVQALPLADWFSVPMQQEILARNADGVGSA